MDKIVKKIKKNFTLPEPNDKIYKWVEISTPPLYSGNRAEDHEEVYRMKKYEIMYIVNASLEEAARNEVMNGLHKIITDHEGSIDKVDEWGVKEFAYEINHMKKGYYVVMNVTANNEGIKEFDRLARINHSIVRYMIIKTEGEE